MENIPGWFPEENYRVLDELIKKYNIKTVIEIGSFVGKSTVFFAERCDKVIAIEPFNALDNCDYLDDDMKTLAKNQRAEFDKNTARFNNIVVLPSSSKKAIDEFEELEADMVFIDGAHDYDNVKLDIGMWFNRAKIVICGDDYSEWWPDVRKAVDEMLLEANKDNRVWYFIKK